jgi:LPS export ABC transporter protein LptC/lipopolysaccharide transport protein LptA
MRPLTARRLRHGLLLVVVGVALAVAFNLRRPPAASSPGAGATPAAEPSNTTFGDLVYRQFNGDRPGIVVRAKHMVGQQQDEMQLQGVEATFHYVAQGKTGTGTIVSNECRYNSGQQRALFKGQVHLTTEDGFELRSESLIYRGDKSIAKTADPVTFSRKTTSGSSTGMEYHGEEGRLTLPADAYVRIESEDGPPTEIRSQRATSERAEGVLRFEEDVSVTQGTDTLKAQKLTVNLTEDMSAVYRAVAVDDVELHTGASGLPLPGMAGSSGGKGPRHLKAKRLDVWFRPNKALQEATAGPDADLEVLPARGEAAERKRIRARFLAFAFDEQGRLQELRGQKDSFLSTEPLEPPKGSKAPAPPRTVTCQSFVAIVDPESGLTQNVDFTRDVEFVDGARKGRAQKARYEEEKKMLFLRDDPQLVDDEQGSDLRAQTIDIGTETNDVVARPNVRHTIERKREGGTQGLFDRKDVPTVIIARRLDYDGKSKTARYTDNALLRSGKDEVRAPTIVIQEPEAGKRRLTGSGGVTSILNQKPKDPGKPPAPVDTRSQDMVYEEAIGQVVYTGDVVIHQGDIQTKSPRATLTLTPDGSRLQKLVAGEPVDVDQGARHATGRTGTYTPDDETMVLVGERVVLKDPSQQLEGRWVTFHVGDDRILIDGQEQVRTQAIFKTELPKP